MSETAGLMAAFVAFVATLKGDEKGEAQVFCDRLFRAFGHQGYKEAGAVLEERVKLADGRTKFVDLRWGNRVVLEMKKRGVRLGSPPRSGGPADPMQDSLAPPQRSHL